MPPVTIDTVRHALPALVNQGPKDLLVLSDAEVSARPKPGLLARFKAAFSSLGELLRGRRDSGTLDRLCTLAEAKYGQGVAQDVFRASQIKDARHITVRKAAKLVGLAHSRSEALKTLNAQRVGEAAARVVHVGSDEGADPGPTEPREPHLQTHPLLDLLGPGRNDWPPEWHQPDSGQAAKLNGFLKEYARRRAAEHPEAAQRPFQRSDVEQLLKACAKDLTPLFDLGLTALPELLEGVLQQSVKDEPAAQMLARARRAAIDASAVAPQGPLAQAWKQCNTWRPEWNGDPQRKQVEAFAQELLRRHVEEHLAGTGQPWQVLDLRILERTCTKQLSELFQFGLTGLPECLGQALKRGLGGDSAANLMRHARALVIEEHFGVMLRMDEDSVLTNAVLELSNQGDKVPMNLGTTQIMDVIARSMKDDFTHRAYSLNEALGLSADAPIATVLERSRDRLVANVQKAVNEHFEALRQIERTSELSPAQKGVLVEFAQRHRLDPVQVDNFIKLAATFGTKQRELQRYITDRRNPAAALSSLQQMRDAFLKSCQQMGAHAENMWLSRDLADRSARNTVFELCTKLVVADLSADEARAAFVRLTGLAAPGAAPAGADRPSPLETVQVMMQACSQASAQTTSDLKGQFVEIVLAFAQRGGVLRDPPPHLLPEDAADASSPQQRAEQVEQRIADMVAGDHRSLAQMPIDVLEQVLFEVEKGGQIVDDANGTVIGLPAAGVVAASLDFDEILGKDASTYESEGVAVSMEGDDVGPLADDFANALEHMDLSLDGVPLMDAGAADRRKRFTGFFGDSVIDRRVALLASKYMNPAMLEKWAARLDAVALEGRTDLVRHDRPWQAAFRIDRDARGNVTLTATLADPTSVARAPGAQQHAWRDGRMVVQVGDRDADVDGPQRPDGVILSQVVFEIPADSIDKRDPVVKCKTARAIFAF